MRGIFVFYRDVGVVMCLIEDRYSSRCSWEFLWCGMGDDVGCYFLGLYLLLLLGL
jgi:hypothetical protein